MPVSSQLELRNQPILDTRIQTPETKNGNGESRLTHVQVWAAGKLNKRSVAAGQTLSRSHKSPPRQIIHDRAHDRVSRDSLQQCCAAGDYQQAEQQDGRDDCDHLLDSLLAGADPSDVLAYRCAAVGAYTAPLDDQVGPALGAFDFGPQRHRESDRVRAG